MKVVILAGGFGSRLSEYTHSIPKPMVPIGDKPILFHIMNYYSSFGHNEFIIALGYKANIIKDYFLNYKSLNSDLTIDMKDGSVSLHGNNSLDWKVTLIDTGKNSMTGGRLLKLKKYLDKDDFMLTYGDGLSNIDINKLIKFHKKQDKIVTVSAVRPVARFGELIIENENVIDFQEKPQIEDGWINGGFFVMKPVFLNFINDESTILEREPLERAALSRQLAAYKHNDFWQCMDTKRDKDRLEEMYLQKSVPWIKK